MTIATKEFAYAPPGAAGSPVPLRERYNNLSAVAGWPPSRANTAST